uniref:SSXT domain-containing protein n=1 Tax=Rhabditophanes sp. KR3021 TaxID=114890 RepID=A0AC35TPB6_9BILA
MSAHPNNQQMPQMHQMPQMQQMQQPQTSVGPAEQDISVSEELSIKQMLEENTQLIECILKQQETQVEAKTIPVMSSYLKQLHKNIVHISRFADQSTQEEANGLQEVPEEINSEGKRQ